MRIPGTFTIVLLTAGLTALPHPTVAYPLAGGDGGPTSDRSAAIDRRPEGLTATPYDLETFETSVSTAQTLPGDPATFDLFGFRLGMSVREADRNARHRHLRFNGGDGMSPSFEGRVAISAARLLGRKIPRVPRILERTSMADADGNHYMLQFLPMEQGGTLASIAYHGSLDGNTPAQLLKALQARFGKPTHQSIGASGFDARWCSKGDQALALCDEKPAFAANGVGTVDMALFLGNRTRRDLDRRIEAKAVAVAATQRRQPAF